MPARARPHGQGLAKEEASFRNPEEVARELCLRMLAVRPRTRAELAATLIRRGVPTEAADVVLHRFEEVGLVDDPKLAVAWVSSRHKGRGLAPRVLAGELRRRGVADGVIEEAVQTIDRATEAATARQLVARRLRATASLPPRVRASRLAGVLARKGYPPGLAWQVVREVIGSTGMLDDPSDPLLGDGLADQGELIPAPNPDGLP